MYGTWPSEFERNPIVYQGTFASAPTAVGRTGQLVQFTDLNNSFWYSDGTNWKPMNGQASLMSSSYPVGIAPTSTSVTSATGALLLGTALDKTYSGGIWLYFAAMGTKAAGWYFCIMSSTTVGVVYGTPQSSPDDTQISVTPFTEAGGPFATFGS